MATTASGCFLRGLPRPINVGPHISCRCVHCLSSDATLDKLASSWLSIGEIWLLHMPPTRALCPFDARCLPATSHQALCTYKYHATNIIHVSTTENFKEVRTNLGPRDRSWLVRVSTWHEIFTRECGIAPCQEHVNLIVEALIPRHSICVRRIQDITMWYSMPLFSLLLSYAYGSPNLLVERYVSTGGTCVGLASLTG